MTDFTKADVAVIIEELDQQRMRMNLSYQAVADSCEVSQATIIRVFKRQVSPTYELLQKIAAAVCYEPHAQVVTPTGYTADAYNEYLQKLVVKQQGDYERQLLQQEARFNRQHAQDRRTVKWLCFILAALVAAFIIWLIIDVTHPTVGWFQREVAARGGSILGNLFGSSGTAFL